MRQTDRDAMSNEADETAAAAPDAADQEADASSSGDPAATPAEKAAETRPAKSSLWRKLGNALVVLWLAFVAIGQVWMWLIWDPPMGRSMPMLVTCSMAIVTTFVLLFWLVVLSRLRWAAVIPLALLIVLPAGVLIASIRDIEFTGDMQPVVHFAWEPTQLERLERLREAALPASSHGETYPESGPQDMPEYRGHGRDGVIEGPPLLQDWNDASLLEVWRRPCGGGYSSFAVVDDYAITLEQRGEEETVVCYSVETGGQRWTHVYPAHFDEAMGGPGPRSTPTIHEGKVFTLGAIGDLYCLDLLDGSVLWHVNILEDNALLRPTGEERRLVARWAMTSSPLIVDDRVVVNAGGPHGNGLVAYDVETAARIWQAPGLVDVTISAEDDVQNRAGYSSPMLVELGGVRQIINFDGVGLHGYDPASGERLWDHFFGKAGGDVGVVNVAQPLLLSGNRLFISASYGRGCAMLRIEQNEGDWSVTRLWPEDGRVNLNLRSKFSSPVLHEGYIYGLDEGIMVCLDPETGEREWKGGRYGHGQMLLTNGRIFLLSERGEMVLVDPNPEEWREITRLEVLPGAKTWNPPALVRGRALVRNHFEAACFDLSAN